MPNSRLSAITAASNKKSDSPFHGKENKPAQRVSGASAPPTISQNPDPYSNTGGKVVKNSDRMRAGGDGKQMTEQQEAALRKRYEQSRQRKENCIIDWFSFTVPASAVHPDYSMMDTGELVSLVGQQLFFVLGYDIVEENRSGRFNYARSWSLGRPGWGFIAAGGNGGGIFVSLTGTGLHAAKQGWEQRLHKFLVRYKARITRVDFATDFFNGEVTVDWVREQYLNGGFNAGGRWPKSSMPGNWDRPDGHGRSYVIGNRENGKMLIGYEKGMQLGDPESKWVRLEGRFGNRDRVLPYDVLLYPTKYFVGMYPCLKDVIRSVEVCRIKTKTKAVEIAISHTFRWLSNQYGRFTRACENFMTPEEIIENIRSNNPEPPEKMRVPSFYDSLPALRLRKNKTDIVRSTCMAFA